MRTSKVEDNDRLGGLYPPKETTMHCSIPTGRNAGPPSGIIDIPDVIPVFPLPKVVLLPGEVLPLHIFEPRYRDMVRDALAGHRVIGMVDYAPDFQTSEASPTPVREVGCAGFIAQHEKLPDGRYLLFLLGLERFRIDEELPSGALYRTVRVTYTPVHPSARELAGMQPLRNELRQVLPRLVDLDDDARAELEQQMGDVSDSQLIALACQILELPSRRKQQVLEADNQVDRFVLVYEDLYRHLDDHPDVGGLAPETLN
jgi:Lon protease-like protein